MLILGLRRANVRRRYLVTTSLIDWAQAGNLFWYDQVANLEYPLLSRVGEEQICQYMQIIVSMLTYRTSVIISVIYVFLMTG